jgi:hypothetical protein
MVVVNKGYTLTVVSWENDGDHYNTKSKTVDTKEEAEALYNLMQMCKSENRVGGGLGNACDFSSRQKQAIIDFFKSNPILVGEDGVDEDDDYIELFYDYSYSLLGGSEWYVCRVMETCTVTYSTDTISVEEIKF